MTYEEFLKDVNDGVTKMLKKYPYLRYGQAVFNYVDLNYEDTARTVQYLDNIDCFYDDSLTNKFLDHCWRIVHKMCYHSKGLTEWPTEDNVKESEETVEGTITNAGGEYGYDVAAFRFDDNHTYTVLLKHTGKRKYGDKVKLVIFG
jgi:hypothetical protein